MSTQSKIKILDSETEEVLYEYSLEDSDDAYNMAKQLEEMGIDFKFHHPNVTETLCDTLGLTFDEKDEYEQSVTAEIEDHDGSCCHKPYH